MPVETAGVASVERMSSNHWSDLKALIMEDLAGVTEADLAACGGRRDKLIEKLQEIYGISTDEAEGAVMYYEHRLSMWYDRRHNHAVN